MGTNNLQCKLKESNSYQEHLQDKLNEATETINTLKELFGSLEKMVADKDEQLFALSNEIETSQRERCNERDALQGELSTLSNELQTLQKESDSERNMLHEELATVTNVF